MKKLLFSVISAAALCTSASATTLYRLSFDSATSTTWESGRYDIGPGEVLSNVTGTGSGLGVLPYGAGGNFPSFVTAASVPAINVPVQGGKAVSLDATTNMDGVVVDFETPFGTPTSLTFEAAFIADSLPPAGNTAGLSYLISTEWPDGAGLDHNLRIQNDKVHYVVQRNPPALEVVAEAPAALVPGRWYHVAGVLNYNSTTPASSSISIWVDGVSAATAPIDLSAGQYTYFFYSAYSGGPNYGNMFAIGHNPGGNEFTDRRGLDGAVDAIAISDAALNAGSFVLTNITNAAKDWTLFE